MHVLTWIFPSCFAFCSNFIAHNIGVHVNSWGVAFSYFFILSAFYSVPNSKLQNLWIFVFMPLKIAKLRFFPSLLFEKGLNLATFHVWFPFQFLLDLKHYRVENTVLWWQHKFGVYQRFIGWKPSFNFLRNQSIHQNVGKIDVPHHSSS